VSSYDVDESARWAASAALRPFARCASDHLLALRLELVGAALEEQDAEDELLVLGGIHLAAPDVGSTEQVTL
jgi:hypothetical protein